MKGKLLVVGVLLALLTFAHGDGHYGDLEMHHDFIYADMSEQELEDIEEYKKELSLLSIGLKEVELSIKKLMLEEERDWDKIEDLVAERSEILTEIELIRLRVSEDFEEETGFFGRMRGFFHNGNRCHDNF